MAGLIEDQKNYTRASVEKQLKTYASYGVTTVLSWGTDQKFLLDLRAAQRAGLCGPKCWIARRSSTCRVLPLVVLGSS